MSERIDHWTVQLDCTCDSCGMTWERNFRVEDDHDGVHFPCRSQILCDTCSEAGVELPSPPSKRLPTLGIFISPSAIVLSPIPKPPRREEK
jgi:hypothetical protein